MQLKLKQPKSLAEISKLIDADLSSVTDADEILISCLSGIQDAQPGSITFLSNPAYKKYLPETKASAVLLSVQDAKDTSVTALVTKNPRLSLAKLLNLCATEVDTVGSQIHPSVVIGQNTHIGQNVKIGANVVIGSNCYIGDNSELKPNVTLYDRVRMGVFCTIHSGTVIGSDGFGYALDADGNWIKMPHLGGVLIGDHVEIGSNTSIDRGMIGDTVIADRVIIDNLVQIAHNVRIGAKTAIAGCVGIAGSTSIGENCLIGGASSIVGHITIADRVHITGTSAVNSSISEPGVYSSGLPARENSVWRKNVARFMFLDNMAKKIRDIEKQIKELVKTEQV